MLSGIRPREELEKYGINVIKATYQLEGFFNESSGISYVGMYDLKEDICSYEKIHRESLSAIGTSFVSVHRKTYNVYEIY
ncbi:hypothetical protein E2986_13926 [Frieseomelitta varia]|uniref:Uncharacterized protein n=1 Tax=Frieseomelitta varia TaxID=561572 RepID=A0A833SPA8_9HYME|nr:hypothetical protein E2986_13926 [Frieseomelitta varia]